MGLVLKHEFYWNGGIKTPIFKSRRRFVQEAGGLLSVRCDGGTRAARLSQYLFSHGSRELISRPPPRPPTH